ncbi:hypothetical protein BDU57DRAFT_557120 [Ampelomyces quisqualis]|uniref:Tyrosinase copper-binding domain-containing protein n=1 Tax=Ampelomyces quisqualis TaxID=50730 RepID=A0A6A5QQA4_AMPQU|nr:hypothetical protein BDU57DRAFT_557120 [Ampelomyces quisqualis]
MLFRTTLSESQKRNYIKAVLCLAEKPPKTPAAIAAGAKSRYDDFVVTHIQQTMSIHFTGNFLSWHRYYVWAYEQALRNECGYEGYQPYWNWGLYQDPRISPIFDGSATSLSGDGACVAGRKAICVPNDADCAVRLEPADGGGCVTSGPFAKTIAENITVNPQADGLGYNPRCLSRDLSTEALKSATEERIVSLILNSQDITTFQDTMQYVVTGDLGVHGAGHYGIGGDANGDLYNSPSDPAFFAHHAMVDLTWWTWQNLGPGTRQNAVAGTVTFMNNPPSRNASLADGLDLGYSGVQNITIGKVMDTLAGPFCYVYS